MELVDAEPQWSLYMPGATVIGALSGRPMCFEVEETRRGFLGFRNARRELLQADTEELMRQWVDLLSHTSGASPSASQIRPNDLQPPTHAVTHANPHIDKPPPPPPPPPPAAHGDRAGDAGIPGEEDSSREAVDMLSISRCIEGESTADDMKHPHCDGGKDDSKTEEQTHHVPPSSAPCAVRSGTCASQLTAEDVFGE